MEQSSTIRHAFAIELEQLEHQVLEMGSLAEGMVGQAVESLCRLDVNLALATLQKDDEIDQLDLDIENRCLRLLALQQPAGSDLRTVGTAMKMITDIERIGDLAVDIAKCGMKIEKEFGSTSYVDVPRMATIARTMFREALECFVRRDLRLIDSIADREEQVDQLYRDLREQVHDHMRENPDAVVACSWLLLAIHHLERIADHAVNIAERVQFMVTGSLRQIPAAHGHPNAS